MSDPYLPSLLRRPWIDLWHGLERSLGGSAAGLLRVAAGMLVGWWIYVPVHELCHALACIAAGGQVTVLEVDHLYGGALLARFFPFVVAGSDYAGRLSGFDTFGKDWIYLATDLGPFLLTVFPGVFLLRVGGALGRGFLFGLALPLALAPFLSLLGDAYEIGSIVVTWIPPWRAHAEALRGDDLLLQISQVWGGGLTLRLGVTLAALVGVVWAWLTYELGAGVARLLGRGPVPLAIRPAWQTAEPDDGEP
jgi:hypothetical protein